MNCRGVLLLTIGLHLSVGAAALAGRLVPPADNLSLRPVVDAIQLALQQKHPQTAAALVDGLFATTPPNCWGQRPSRES